MSRRSEYLRQQRLALYSQQRGRCETCGEPMVYEEAELAHRIPDTVWANRKWGQAVIDHQKNKAMTHRGECNDAQNIQGKPIECEAIAQLISQGEGKDEGTIHHRRRGLAGRL